ncbi:hypothetical protein QLQ86_18170 [Halomonas sp. LR5S13]|uniref:hypothetical protein n=1 Tax=Halomonas rhizosphaerae TaxID=3043296 RepID=UPI0024A9C907|nr:hypothetical protein [Halomonas rhizosphaerae]MDI5922700.1 hypothetical protein [Halomonas rhizosphaerae]
MPTIDFHPASLELDVWFKQPENRVSVPNDAEFACLQEVNLGAVDVILEALFFRRHDGQDELWAAGLTHDAPGKPRDEQLACAYQQGRVAWAGSQGSRAAGADILFRALTAARQGHVWPEGCLEGPLITEAAHRRIIGELEAGIERNRQEAELQAQAPTLVLARRLGLRPKPAGQSPSAWYADCPGKAHRLMISSSSDQFGCGYCREKGGPAELEALAHQRQEARS